MNEMFRKVLGYLDVICKLQCIMACASKNVKGFPREAVFCQLSLYIYAIEIPSLASRIPYLLLNRKHDKIFFIALFEIEAAGTRW